jgi:hypothetical protein
LRRREVGSRSIQTVINSGRWIQPRSATP